MNAYERAKLKEDVIAAGMEASDTVQAVPGWGASVFQAMVDKAIELGHLPRDIHLADEQLVRDDGLARRVRVTMYVEAMDEPIELLHVIP